MLSHHIFFFFFFNDTATTEIYTLSLHDALPISLHPHTNYYVGGNTKFYGAALFRLRRQDFGEIRHHGGLSAAWPIDYDELEPYYSEAEHIYQVHGGRGEDPTEPPAGRPYPHRGVRRSPRTRQTG